MKSDQQCASNVLPFRSRTTDARDRRHEDEDPPEHDISRLIDLSRYEAPPDHESADFRRRMVVNLAVLVLLVSFTVAAADVVVDIGEAEYCTPVWQCGLAHSGRWEAGTLH